MPISLVIVCFLVCLCSTCLCACTMLVSAIGSGCVCGCRVFVSRLLLVLCAWLSFGCSSRCPWAVPVLLFPLFLQLSFPSFLACLWLFRRLRQRSPQENKPANMQHTHAQAGEKVFRETHPPACEKHHFEATKALPGFSEARPQMYQCSTGDVAVKCTGVGPGLYQACGGALPVLYWGCVWSVPACTVALQGPYRGHAGAIPAKCTRLVPKPTPAWYGVGSTVSGGPGSVPVSSPGAVVELHRNCTGSAPGLFW